MHLLDTNIISYILENRLGIVERVFDIERKDEIRIPDITYYEIYRGLCFRDAKKLLPVFERFAEYYGIVSLAPSTMRVAAKIYSALKHSGKLIEDDDILIRAEGFIPRRLRRNKGYKTRLQHLMRTTYLDVYVEVC